ncbi:MAG TPA: serine hydrolase domain-containing protein [Chitinophagaceae bacterium]|nr:serine hydrolase domain-containing protein [Chitinophagaceae bacterium]
MRQTIMLFILALLTGLAPCAQKGKSLVAAVPESAGFSSERLQRLDNALKAWVDSGWYNGGVGLVIRDGKIVYYKAAGYDDLQIRTPLARDGIFRIASQTKAITSVAIMILYEEGKLLLSDPVSKYIPSFKKQTVLDKFNAADTTYTTVPVQRDITIKDLLTHTSGIGYAQIGSREANAIYAKYGLTAGIAVTNETLLQAMSRLGTLPLLHQPGQKWTYGLNTDLLGCLVEVISGKSLDEFFRARIFEPLGMKDTYFMVPDSKAKRLVNLYREDSTGQLVKSTGQMLNGNLVGPDYPLKRSTYYSGGAGLSSTIYDYAIFLQMLLNGGIYNGKRILSRNTVRMMTMNQIGDLVFRNDDKFGLGFQLVSEKNGNVPAQAGTFSWGGAFATSYWVDPKEKMVLLFYRQLQRTTKGEVVEKFRALAYQAIND